MNPLEQNIKNALHIDKLSAEEQQEIIERVGVVIYQNVLMRVLPGMSDEQENEFERLLDANASPEEIFGFLNTNVPNLEQVIQEEAEQFRNKASNIMSQIG